jgi:hypothetical protein
VVSAREEDTTCEEEGPSTGVEPCVSSDVGEGAREVGEVTGP